jgi:hypothetical protein
MLMGKNKGEKVAPVKRNGASISFISQAIDL